MKPQRRTLSLVILILTSIISTNVHATQPNANKPEMRLRQYIELRLRWADWKQYSDFVTWPDEPGWDCWWVANSYRMAKAVESKSKIVIPVTYDRIGLFCANFTFEDKAKAETINYELIHSDGSWKVNGPVPDYPYVSIVALRHWLKAITTDTHETRERKLQAQEALNAVGEEHEGMLCVAPFPKPICKGDVCISGTQGFSCASGNVSLRVDSRNPVPWPKDASMSVTGLATDTPHRVALLCDGKPAQSFKLHFSVFKNNKACLSVNELYGWVQLWELDRHAPWCKCEQ